MVIKEMSRSSPVPDLGQKASTMTGVKKQLPSTPSTAESLTSATIPTSPLLVKNYGPFFLEYSLLTEYNQLQNQKLPGVYVIPSAKSALVWFGVLFIRQGLYQDGVFKFTMFIPDDYPNSDSPRFVFDHPVFHPLIHPETGELDVKRGFPKWRRNVNHLWQVLLYARRVFYKIDVTSPQNPEAAVLYENNLEAFKEKVLSSIHDCKAHLYDPPNTEDPHAIRFGHYDEVIHDPIRTQILQAKETGLPDRYKSYPTGLSWMDKGSNKIFSTPDCPGL